MTRYCASCSKPLPADSRPDKDTCDSTCRGKAWRAQQKLNREQLVLQAERPRSGVNARSGRQVSYEKAVEAVAVGLARHRTFGTPATGVRFLAEAWLREALPERQRR